MNRERVKDFAFSLVSFCSMVLIVGAALLSAYLTTITFVTQYSVLAERYVDAFATYDGRWEHHDRGSTVAGTSTTTTTESPRRINWLR